MPRTREGKGWRTWQDWTAWRRRRSGADLVVEVDADDFAAAMDDPRVLSFLEESRRYLADVEPVELVQEPCGHCWGRGRILEPVDTPEGRTHRDDPCPRCLGTRTTFREAHPGT